MFLGKGIISLYRRSQANSNLVQRNDLYYYETSSSDNYLVYIKPSYSKNYKQKEAGVKLIHYPLESIKQSNIQNKVIICNVFQFQNL